MNFGDLSWVLPVASATMVVGGACIMLARFTRKGVAVFSRVSQFLDDWQGEPERPGFPAVPGIPERIQKIEEVTGDLDRRVKHVETQLRPNGGSSLVDGVKRIERSLGATRTETPRLEDS